jgi:hypothetical protein
MKVKNYGFDEEYAVRRIPHGFQCKERSEGLPHRVGIFPMMSAVDGGLAGCYCKGICIHCGKEFKSKSGFIIMNQPNQIRNGC